MVGSEQSVEAEHRGEQGGHPNDAGADPSQHLRLGSDPEREQHHRQHEKPKR